MKRFFRRAFLILSAVSVAANLCACDWKEEVDNPSGYDPNIVVITFVQDGEEDIIKKVRKGESIEAPEPKQAEGYTTVWDTTDFSNIQESMRVTAVRTANEYTIYYDLNYKGASEQTQTVTYGEEYSLLRPNDSAYRTFEGWYWLDENGKKVYAANGVWNSTSDLYLTARWGYWSDFV